MSRAEIENLAASEKMNWMGRSVSLRPVKSTQKVKISKVAIIINRTKSHAQRTAAAFKAVLDREGVAERHIS